MTDKLREEIARNVDLEAWPPNPEHWNWTPWPQRRKRALSIAATILPIIARARAEALEEAAKVAEKYGSLNGRDTANEIADDIRALK
jgi:hypothetical protein